jgi:hypothetical protein
MSVRTVPPSPGGGTRGADHSRYREAHDAWCKIPGRRSSPLPGGGEPEPKKSAPITQTSEARPLSHRDQSQMRLRTSTSSPKRLIR